MVRMVRMVRMWDGAGGNEGSKSLMRPPSPHKGSCSPAIWWRGGDIRPQLWSCTSVLFLHCAVSLVLLGGIRVGSGGVEGEWWWGEVLWAPRL